jgi:hypothetical protein
VAEYGGIVDQVMPPQLRLDVVAVQHHVGIKPMDDLAIRREHGLLTGHRFAPASGHGEQPGVLRTHLGQLQRRL